MAKHYLGLLQQKIDALESLPIQANIALRFVELGKNADAELDDYVQLVQADAALSTRFLALANSPWFGVRQRVVKVKQAVGLLGITNVRALAVSYCLAGLHSAWKLDPEDARGYWEASLCKAVAAKLLTQQAAPKRAEEAFTLALFQDVAVSLLVHAVGQPFAERLRDPGFTVEDQLDHERHEFAIDHPELGRRIAERLDLPSMYVAGIAAHHSPESLTKAVADPGVASALHVSTLLPHDMRSWKPADVSRLEGIVQTGFAKKWPDAKGFVGDLQQEFGALIGMLSNGSHEPPSLTELLAETCAANARNTSALVGQVHSLVAGNQNLLRTLSETAARQTDAERRACHDALTGLLNRVGLAKRVDQLIAQGGGKISGGVVIFDVDNFKTINDTFGHDCGDLILKTIAGRILSASRADECVCRWGGDEIVAFYVGVGQDDCGAVGTRLQRAITSEPVLWQGRTLRISLSAGVCWLPQVESSTALSQMISAADRQLLAAKTDRRAPATPAGAR